MLQHIPGEAATLIPTWYAAGQIALGNVGHNGDWKYHKDWVEAGKVADGLGHEWRRLEDYMVVNPDNGAVNVWWNYSPDDDWYNGWNFVEGGQIASGVPHANWETLQFPDINGDGRAGYVYIGEDGALRHHMNTGSEGWPGCALPSTRGHRNWCDIRHHETNLCRHERGWT
ncbi:Fc.00g004030.m01.CDS01 [Cosmosporella sp. VM-42]